LKILTLNVGKILIQKNYNGAPLFFITMCVVHFGVLCVFSSIGVGRTTQQAGSEGKKLQGNSEGGVFHDT
jgi:hypothetical protein